MKLREKIETKFEMLDVKENESTKIIKRGKIKKIEKHVNKIETPSGRDSRSESKNARAND